MIIDKILLATGNAHKLKEVREILEPLGIEVLSPDSIGGLPDVIEDGDTFEANAIKKAEEGLAHSGIPVIADDSGIEAMALDWRPGVYSARYAGSDCDDEANNKKLCEELDGKDDKFVRYRCVIAFAFPESKTLTFSGAFDGIHTDSPLGTNGFGYDPYVYIGDLGKTVAELSEGEKNSRSHRGEALRKFVDFLKNN